VIDVLGKENWALGWEEKNKEVLAYTQGSLAVLKFIDRWQKKTLCSIRACLAIAPVGLLFVRFYRISSANLRALVA